VAGPTPRAGNAILTLVGTEGTATLPTAASSSATLAGAASATGAYVGAVRPARIANALLPLLPEPLSLRHGPLLVTLQWWPDGLVVADLPACALYGSGDSDTAALEDLGNVMLDWASGVNALGEENIAGGLRRQWLAFKALVEVSRL
jgi:hypothetical protein